MTKNQLKNLYSRWVRNDPYTQRALEYAARSIYPKVLDECTWTDSRGRRRWTGASDSTIRQIQAAFQAFVEVWERGHMTFQIFDAVIWAVHHNGVMADKFISDCHTEEEAIEFLNELGGIKRS